MCCLMGVVCGFFFVVLEGAPPATSHFSTMADHALLAAAGAGAAKPQQAGPVPLRGPPTRLPDKRGFV